ncbi:nickel-dependent hydrogenase large subunit [Escherichia coli]
MRGRSLNVSAASVLAYTLWLRFTPSKMQSVLKCRTTPISSATLCLATLWCHDHLVHFYQLAGMDWIDVLDGLKADPRKTSELAQSLSSWPKSSPGYFFDVQKSPEEIR